MEVLGRLGGKESRRSWSEYPLRDALCARSFTIHGAAQHCASNPDNDSVRPRNCSTSQQYAAIFCESPKLNAIYLVPQTTERHEEQACKAVHKIGQEFISTGRAGYMRYPRQETQCAFKAKIPKAGVYEVRKLKDKDESLGME
jgi:hypothetical protein